MVPQIVHPNSEVLSKPPEVEIAPDVPELESFNEEVLIIRVNPGNLVACYNFHSSRVNISPARSMAIFNEEQHAKEFSQLTEFHGTIESIPFDQAKELAKAKELDAVVLIKIIDFTVTPFNISWV